MLALKNSLEMYLQMPFYRERIGHSDTERAYEEFSKLPLLSPEDVTRHSPPFSNDLVYKRERLGPVLNSGGSSGRRKIITHSWDFNQRVVSLGRRAIEEALEEKPLVLANCFSSGSLYGGYFFVEGVAQDLGCQYLPLGSRMEFNDYYDIFNDFKVDTIVATPTFFTDFVEKLNGQELPKNLQNLLFIGESFPKKEQAKIQKRFPNINIRSLAYSTTETGPIGYQCRHLSEDEHHINDDHVYVEILDPNDQGVGEVVVTTLLNDGQPVLRYQVGDLGRFVQKECACGSSRPILKLEGRTNSSINFLGSIFRKKQLLELINAIRPVEETDLQVVYGYEESLDILINSDSISTEELRRIKEEILKDYPSSKKAKDRIQVQKKERHEFKKTNSGKTPFFVKKDS